ncbi:MAG: sulfotransferase [Mucilaginibacter sp.]|uniref:sulfotransferase n=1 Tax=Mucilaginibacter sp. TaxID=1882438 RepID=UPI0031A069BF
MPHSSLKNWIPYQFDKQLCYWLNTHTEPFTEPFFDDTINKCKKMGNRYFTPVSRIEMLKEWADDLDYIAPTAFIFHVSRCGSTLVSQLLATARENMVLSEVPFFDDLLRLPFQGTGFNQNEVSSLLDAAIRIYGQKRTGHEQHLFIKTDSWHIFFYEQLRSLYPDVPFILMYRNPDEVLASHLKIPGMQAVPGLIEPALFGFEPDDITYNRPDIYTSRVLEKYLERYHHIINTDSNCLLLNYNEGPMAMINKIAAFTNTPISDGDLAAMNQRSQYHSKRPGEAFQEETQPQKPLYINKAMELYDELEYLVLK